MPASRIAFRILQSFVWLMLFMVVDLFIIVPAISLLLAKKGYHSPQLSDSIAILQQCNGVIMHIFIYAYVAFFGSCIASFLNVVAWRVPRGRSILGSSHCPACDHRLSMRDNIPVWGWLKNEGSCRHCQSSIAQRYLWVEVLLGCVFLILFVVEIVFGGFNLPTAPDLRLTGIEFVLFAPNAQLIQTFAFHATLMSILFTVVMISSESFRIPVAFRKEKGKERKG
ncbi:prepilin peptidase, partial [Planctomycetes bacterium CA13]|uniref:prepilin peptidase n=1 Tax=Novipirellula herctigrandis TaxID=2527986 RepID=UPI0011B7C262